MKSLKLIAPDKSQEQAALEFVEEFENFHSKIAGFAGLDRFERYDDWLAKLRQDAQLLPEPSPRVPASCFFALDEKARIIGITQIRHQLNDTLVLKGGHIGYSVRPTERQQGYAHQILHLALLECQKLGLSKVLVTCDKTNLASRATILRAGGKFENEIILADFPEPCQRYWIDLSTGLA